jgi:hypothetical protein
MSEERKRADLGFGSTFDEVDASDWVGAPRPRKERGVDTEIVKEVAAKSGFQSRGGGSSPAPKKRVIARMQKNFRPKVENCEKFDFLAALKVTGKEGPELIDEALEMLFKKYKADMEFFEALKQRRAVG